MTDKEKQQQEEQELANQIKPLINEVRALEEKRSNGISLEKSFYMRDRLKEIEQELSKLKKPKEGASPIKQ